jgi:hypothetical protein
MAGADGYYFGNYVCGLTKDIETDVLAKAFFSILPCNEIVLKGLLFVIFFACLLILVAASELFNKKNGWLAGYFFFLQTQWIHPFMELENDVLAFPFLFLSIYLFCRGIVEKNQAWKVLALVSIIIAAGFWKGAIFYLVAYSLTFLPALLLFLAGLPRLFNEFFGYLVPKLVSSDVLPVLGFFQNYFLLIAFILPIPELFPAMVWFSLLSILNLKLAIHVVPFLAMSMVVTFNYLLKSPKKEAAYLSKILLIIPILMVGIVFFGVFIQYPQAQTIEAIDYAIQEAKGTTINNDWDLGYWIEWRHGIPLYWGGEGPVKPFKGTIVLTSFGSDCELIAQYQNTTVWGAFRDLNVYACPQ